MKVLLVAALLLAACIAARALPVGWEWQLPRPQGYTLCGVSFVDMQHGWAVGDYGTILNTTDGGQSWSPLNSGTDDWFTSV